MFVCVHESEAYKQFHVSQPILCIQWKPSKPCIKKRCEFIYIQHYHIPWESALKRSQPNHITEHTQTFCIHTHTHISVTLYTARFFLFCLLFFSLLLFSFFLKVYDFGGCDFAITNRLHAFHSVSHFYCGFLSNCLSISFFSAFIPIKNLTFTF